MTTPNRPELPEPPPLSTIGEPWLSDRAFTTIIILWWIVFLISSVYVVILAIEEMGL